MLKKYKNNDWLCTNQNNENGYSVGHFNGETNKWEANIHLKNGKNYHYTSISHWKVNQWLEKMRKDYDLK